jgi:glucuronate isomerase
MNVQWEAKVGPASIVAAAGIIIQCVVVVWVASSIYTGLTRTIVEQGAKIEKVEKGSADRFKDVRDNIKTAHEAQMQNQTRLSIVENTVGFIKDSVTRLEASIKK